MNDNLKYALEAVIMANNKPVSLAQLNQIFADLEIQELKTALASLQDDYQNRGINLRELASGYCFYTHESYSAYVNKLWEEKAPRLSRALLEILSIIVYKQPLTRGDIEVIRGVAVSANILRTLLDYEWIKVVGHKDSPGKPALYATTKQFLDSFNIKSLDELPELPEVAPITNDNE